MEGGNTDLLSDSGSFMLFVRTLNMLMCPHVEIRKKDPRNP
jgi:hypothetical protein